MRGREEVLGFLGVMWDAFPDGRLETSRLLAEGSGVAAEGRFIGTHTGVMRTPEGEIPATGPAGRLPLDVQLRGSRRKADLGASVLRSGRAARSTRRDAGALSAFALFADRAPRGLDQARFESAASRHKQPSESAARCCRFGRRAVARDTGRAMSQENLAFLRRACAAGDAYWAVHGTTTPLQRAPRLATTRRRQSSGLGERQRPGTAH
jgi:hypothetical protein